ncbi:MAG: hypothetical protein AAB790_03690 [Patescibacteria group bacterium]
MHVTAPLVLVRKRLHERKNHHFGPELLDAWIARHWEEPAGEDFFLIENAEEKEALVSQLDRLCGSRHGR